MPMKRRDFINVSGMAAGTAIVAGLSACRSENNTDEKSTSTAGLTSMTADVVPISDMERQARIEKAQRLMVGQNIAALVLDAGTAMEYFTGIIWGLSERTTAAIIPARGEVRYVCPGFEESRLHELIRFGKDVYVWQ